MASATRDPFETLGIPRRFALDVKMAEARHRELSRALHPDRYASTPGAERRMALSRAIEVNEAWRAVRDPIRRAEAILRLEGFEGEFGETREPKPTGAFLMEVLERREALEEVRASGNAATLAEVVADARARNAAAEHALADAIDAGIGDRERLRRAIPLLGELRYAARFLEEAQRAEDQLAGF